MGKLKRFLLRYDPPGIGLEVEDEKGVGVRHVSLPANAEVSTGKDISALVDKLITDEEMLTKRRHRPALLQLLGRLYQVEVDPTDDEAEAAAAPPAQADKGASVDGFQEGQQVVLVNLKGNRQNFNGELGTLTKLKKDKCEVLVTAGRAAPEAEVLKVKVAENIVPTAPKGTPLTVGVHVAIRGLRNHVELNGCLGRVVECHVDTHRFEVRATESGQLFRVKQENLIPIDMGNTMSSNTMSSKENLEPNTNLTPRKKEASGGAAAASAPAADAGAAAGVAAAGDGTDEILEPGSQVQLVGLKTAMCYNGQTAEVLSVDRVRCRYEIRLNDGSVKTIRAENVRLVNGNATKTSPRTRRKEGAAAGGGKR